MMYFTKEINLFGEGLEVYRTCFSKPQWDHFKAYIHGLLLGEKGEKNIQDIAQNVLRGKHQSSLNRFLTRPRWDVRKLNAIRLKTGIHHREGGVVVLDDTLIEKTGMHMDGVGYLFDHGRGRMVLCHDIVSTLYRRGQRQVPLFVQPYIKKDGADQQDRWFKTRIQIALDLLRLSLMQVHPDAVVFDAWYMSQVVVDFLDSRGITWVSEAKNNRLILVDGWWISVKKYAKDRPEQVFHRMEKRVGENRFRWIRETVVMMKNVGWVKLVILRMRRNSRSCTFLVSNNIRLGGLQVLEYYKKRWSIEVFHRDCKQHLGMGEYQARKLDAVVIHLHLVFLVYTLLKNAWCNPFLCSILEGIQAVGSACKKLKRWVFTHVVQALKNDGNVLSI